MIFLTRLLLKLFLRQHKNTCDSRLKFGNFASIIGIICNLLLCALKGVTGVLVNSVSMVADAVNNLSDAGNSIISLIGFVMSGKPADKDHPYGHARVEYVSCMAVSFVILFFGLSLLKSSFTKLLTPEPLAVGYVSVSILIISILLKMWMSLFYKKIAKIIDSDVLFANSRDSLNDVASTSAVLITSLIAMFTNINLDGYAGIVVSAFIIYTGIDIFRSTIDNLLGKTPDKALVNEISKKVLSYDGVMGIHDLVVHNYGPDSIFATVHVEVSVHDDILSSHDLIDNIERDFAKNMKINMVIHLDPVITDDVETNNLRNKVKTIINNIDSQLNMHDFRMVKGETHSNLIFDVVVPDSCKIPIPQLVEEIEGKVKDIDENLFAVITIDRNYITSK